MSKLLDLLLIHLVFCSALSLKLPEYIKKCSIKDPNFNKCALKNAREAIPSLIKGERKYNFPVLDPFVVKEIKSVDDHIDVAGLDILVQGLKDVVLQSISFDFDKKKINVEVLVPEAQFHGNYEAKGKLVALPISGNGPFNATFHDLYVNYTTGYDLKKLDDGQVYLVPEDFSFNYDIKKFSAHFENLFNGNKLLADSMNLFINENWRLVLKEIGQPAYERLGLIVHNILLGLTKTVPYKDIFNDTE